jgi:hypothetical protein
MTSGPMSSGAAFVVPRWMPGWAGDPLSLLAQNLGVRTACHPQKGDADRLAAAHTDSTH